MVISFNKIYVQIKQRILEFVEIKAQVLYNSGSSSEFILYRLASQI